VRVIIAKRKGKFNPFLSVTWSLICCKRFCYNKNAIKGYRRECHERI